MVEYSTYLGLPEGGSRRMPPLKEQFDGGLVVRDLSVRGLDIRGRLDRRGSEERQTVRCKEPGRKRESGRAAKSHGWEWDLPPRTTQY